MTNIVTAYSKKNPCPITFEGKGRTKQSHKNECDINLIVSKYQKTGVITFVNTYDPTYGDIPSVDFQEAMNTILQAEEMFAELPSSARKHFDNDPHKFLQAVENPDFKQTLEDLGLAKPSPVNPIEPVPENPDRDLPKRTKPAPAAE